MFRRSRPARAVALLAPAAALTLVLAGLTAPAATAATGWTVTFRDDFSGTGLPDAAKWKLTLGTSYPGGPAQFGTGEFETNTGSTANVRQANGDLLITPIRDSAGQWTSARVETIRSDFKAPTGGELRVDARIAMPNVTGAAALGYWPAFWMLGSPYRSNPWSWPGIGEFDIMENVQGIDKNWATLHCGVWGGPCHEPDGISNNGVTCSHTACQGNFHTYSFVWDRSGPVDQLRWYTDDVLTHSVRQTDVPVDTWTQMTSHAGYFMILNVAIGGAFPNKLGGGPSAQTVSGVPMTVDWVQAATTPGTGGGSSSSSPSTATTSSSTTSTSATTPTSTTTSSSTPTSSSTTTPGGSAPANLRVTGTTSSTITVGWTGSSSGSYDVLRSGVRIATVTGTSFTDVGLFPNTPYLYSVRAAGVTTPQITATIGGSSSTSSPSSSGSVVTTAPSGAAVPPSALRVTATTASTITLGWSGGAGTSYDVLRAGIRIAGVTGTSFTDTSLVAGAPYLYSIRGAGVTTPEITVTL